MSKYKHEVVDHGNQQASKYTREDVDLVFYIVPYNSFYTLSEEELETRLDKEFSKKRISDKIKKKNLPG